MTRKEKFIKETISLSKIGMDKNERGPFGSVIAKRR